MRFKDWQGEMLSPGTFIRLGGRIGKIELIKDTTPKLYSIFWRDENIPFLSGGQMTLDLEKFPDFQIEIPDPKISRQAFKELRDWVNRQKNYPIHTGSSEETQNCLCLPIGKLFEKLKTMVEDESCEL